MLVKVTPKVKMKNHPSGWNFFFFSSYSWLLVPKKVPLDKIENIKFETSYEVKLARHGHVFIWGYT